MSISHPGRTGIPTYDLSNDEECRVIAPTNFSPIQLWYDRVIPKIFAHYSIPLEITDSVRQIFRSKLQRMGMNLSKIGSKSRLVKLSKWKEGKESTWNLVVDGLNYANSCYNRNER